MECLQERLRMKARQSTTVIGAGRCARCGGFMVDEWSTDLDGNDVQRCVQCGERLDPVIVENRRRQFFTEDAVGSPRGIDAESLSLRNSKS